MIAEVFLDTNVLVYAASKAEEDKPKAKLALDLIASARFGVSGQILQEFYVTTTRKMRIGLSHHEALDWIEALEEFPCIDIDSSLVYQGAETADRYQLSYWDGTVIAAAARLNAQVLYSEDLSDGHSYGSVRVINPFRAH